MVYPKCPEALLIYLAMTLRDIDEQNLCRLPTYSTDPLSMRHTWEVRAPLHGCSFMMQVQNVDSSVSFQNGVSPLDLLQA